MYISTLDIFRTGRVINRFTSSKMVFQLAKQLLLSGKESKARVEQKVLGNTKSMQLDLEGVHRNTYIRVHTLNMPGWKYRWTAGGNG